MLFSEGSGDAPERSIPLLLSVESGAGGNLLDQSREGGEGTGWGGGEGGGTGWGGGDGGGAIIIDQGGASITDRSRSVGSLTSTFGEGSLEPRDEKEKLLLRRMREVVSQTVDLRRKQRFTRMPTLNPNPQNPETPTQKHGEFSSQTQTPKPQTPNPKATLRTLEAQKLALLSMELEEAAKLQVETNP